MLFKNFDEVKEIIFDYLKCSLNTCNNDDDFDVDFLAILEDIENNFRFCYIDYFPKADCNINYNISFNFWYQCSLLKRRTLLIHFNCYPLFSCYRKSGSDFYIDGYIDHFLDVHDWIINSV